MIDLPATAMTEGWSTVNVIEPEPGQQGTRRESMTTLGARLPDGLRLVVASDNYDVQMLRHRLGRFTLLSGIDLRAQHHERTGARRQAQGLMPLVQFEHFAGLTVDRPNMCRAHLLNLKQLSSQRLVERTAERMTAGKMQSVGRRR